MSERCKIGPSPNATKVDKTKEPETFPATVNTAVLRPHARARRQDNDHRGDDVLSKPRRNDHVGMLLITSS
jgi:hypothetical protein